MQQHENGDGPIKFGFLNGMPSAEYNLVVACDGANSRTRAIGLGCNVRDYTESTNCWVAYFSIDQDILEGSKIEHSFCAPGLFSAVGPDSSGVNRVALMGINPRGNPDAMLPFREASKQGEHALKNMMAEYLGKIGWELKMVTNGMMTSKDFYAREIFQGKAPNLSKGRFVMVGDAGYASGISGCGTKLALAGGHVLAGENSKHADGIEAGLRGNEETMRPLIEDLQKIPPFIAAIMAPQTAWGLWLRNQAFAFITWTGVLEVAQRCLAGAFASTDDSPLPEYK